MKVIKDYASAAFATALVAVLVLGYLYLRNGPEYFAGTSGGAYWDHMSYCKTHQAGRQNVYNELVGCAEIISKRKFCRHHPGDTVHIGGGVASCDDMLGKDPPPSPWDAY